VDIKSISEIINNRELRHVDEKKQFAIMIPLISINSSAGTQVYLLFETRSESVEQPGEICFPGGMREKGETLMECAIRETREEIGIGTEDDTPGKLKMIGQFDTFVSHFGSVLYTYIAAVELPDNISLKEFTGEGGYEGFIVEGLDISADEVEDVFLVPLDYFLNNEADVYEIELNPDVPEDFPYKKITGGTAE
jgi:coenzyme A diphosphatase NUDT7